MPYPLLAHQAPVLPLKAWWPGYFNGTALVVGSLAPDLQNFWMRAAGADEIGHTFVGQFTFCLPITMAVVLLVGNLDLGAVIAARLGKRFAWLAGAASAVARPGGIERAVMSALVGSFSHLGFDALTHEAIPAGRLRHFHHVAFTMHSVSQAVASVLGALVALAYLRKISVQNAREAPARRPGAWLLVLGALAGAVLGAKCSMPAIRHPDWYFEAGRVYVWGYAAFLVAAAMGAGALCTAAVLAAIDRRRPPALS